MEISATEIKLLCSKINDSIEGYSVSSIYSIEGGILLRLRHETKAEQMIAISSFAPWLTKKNLALPEAEPFVTRIREMIERTNLSEVKQESGERVATFKFATRAGLIRYLHSEFFGGGNQILADENEIILDASKLESYRHRSIAKGEVFRMPPSRGIPLEEVTEEALISKLEGIHNSEDAKRGQKGLTAVRWFGRTVGTSRKFVEEIFFRSGVPEGLMAANLSRDQAVALAEQSKILREEIESATKGFVIVPVESEDADNSEIEVDVSPLIPHSWKISVERGLAKIESYDSYSEALDQAQVLSYVVRTRQEASREVRRKAAELESAIRKQQAKIEENKKRSSDLRALANSLMTSAVASNGISEDIVGKLEALGVVERDPVRRTIFNFVTEPRTHLESIQSQRALGSRLFDEAKKLEESNIAIIRIMEELNDRKRELDAQAESTEERAEKRREFERRARQWFERYRWFLTSDNHLAVGGRDATSNSIIINKYSSRGDVIFHADIHGSPFFVLKKGAEVLQKESENMELEFELAQATAGFSRAWKEDLSSADAYWVNVEQVKKSAPSGEYLPRGSFFIEGKKNFVKHVRIELCVGVTSSKRIQSFMNDGDTSLDSDDPAYPIVVCGPEKSLSHYCNGLVKISPGRERSSSIARRLKQLLVSKAKEDSEMIDRIKKIPIDEIIRVLPSGNHKLVSEKQNR
jgi:predicted ribosome quality control (RQC) complex YloA/Tae2 family protein